MTYRCAKYVALYALFVLAGQGINAESLGSSEHTAAYWRFETGPADSVVLRPEGVSGYTYSQDVDDVSGNGNHLSVWTQGDWAGFAYRADVPVTPIPLTRSPNAYSVQNTGQYPGMFTMSSQSNPAGKDIEALAFEQFTIEAFFKPENGGYRTIVGRDAMEVASENPALAALYFQIEPDNAMAIKFVDAAGYFHTAQSAAGLIQGFNWDEDPTGLTGTWYYAAAVSDGATLSLYLANITDAQPLQWVAQTHLTASGSPNTALAKGTASGTDWHAGGWSVGRGLYDGRHTDRAYGFIDEVRISDAALGVDELLLSGSSAPLILVEPVSVPLFESGSTSADISIRLTEPPQAEVHIVLDEPAHVNQVLLARSELTFAPTQWAVPQTVRVTAIDDDLLESAEHRAELRVYVNSADEAFNGLVLDPIEAIILDNECGAWGYLSADLNQDCRVDLADVALLADEWLSCSLPDEPACIRFDPDTL